MIYDCRSTTVVVKVKRPLRRDTFHAVPNLESPVSNLPSSYQLIYAAVRRIPKGRVATYGQVARLAGLPRHARLAGYALNALPTGSRVPWHRVVNAKGGISLRSNGLGHDRLQEMLLREEGVRFINGVIPLTRYQWQPRTLPPPVTRTR